MLRQLNIAITTVLVAMHALVVPWHVVSSHGLIHAHASTDAHVHGDEHAETSLAGWHDGSGAPDQHGAHAHPATDHVFSRSRTQELPSIPAALPPAVAQLPTLADIVPAYAARPSPPKAPCLAITFLRGPPVC